jgi:ABC-type branched-subunit amino acid transport system ATPase component
MFLQKRIHQWSTGLALWQRDLLRRLTAGALSESDEEEILAVLTGATDAPTPVPLELDELPADEAEVGPVELREISDLQNINLLAEGQTLRFEPGLNVVFGLTGAGKSGYGRLLRRLCRAAERSEVLRDVFDAGSADAPQRASLKVTVRDEERDLAVDLAQDADRLLSAMAAFDARCAHVYLSGPNTIQHVPRPLLLLGRMAEAQDSLARRLNERADALLENLPLLPEIDPATQAGKAVATITATTDLAKIEELATLSDEEHVEVKKLDVAVATIKSDQSRQLEAAARARARGATTAIEVLQVTSETLSDERLDAIAKLRTRLDDATAAERSLAADAFAGQCLSGTGQGPWREMWESARRFVETEGGTFPDTRAGAACPMCQQDLDEDSRGRMTKFDEFVRSDLRGQIVDLTRSLSREVTALPDVAAARTRVETAVSEAPEEITAIANVAVEALSARADFIRERAEEGSNESPDVPKPPEIARLRVYADDQNAVANAQAALRDEAEQRRVMTRLAELRARETLAAALPSVHTRIAGLRGIARVEAARRELGTTRISNQLRELQQVVITDRLRSAVAEELKELDPVAGRIDVLGQAAKGETVIQLRLKEPCRARVGDVLSEGEQRALALAFFLAEVAVSDGRSAIILDDPVSSLDHERRDYVARRLAEEARQRQVIVFTHDLTFVYMLQEAADAAGQELHGQTLQRAFHCVGMVSDDLPNKAMSPARRRKQLRHRLKTELNGLHERQDPQYEREADFWVTDLRKAYDQLIEDYLLAGVVRRWHSQVRFRQLRHVKWSLESVKRIEAAVKKASIKAHHEATELQPTPLTPEQLSGMLDEYDAICELTHPEKEVNAPTTNPTNVSTPVDKVAV